jgi:hypothetical protein
LTRAHAFRALCALVIALFATLTSVRAGQMWTESQAHAHALSARAAADSALRQAREQGLTSRDLGLLPERLHELESNRAPADSVVWGGARADFYSRQTTALQRFAGNVIGAVARAKRRSYVAARQAVDDLQFLIRQASKVGLNPVHDAREVLHQESVLRHSSSFRDMTHVTRVVSLLRARLAGRIAAQRTQVAQIAAAGDNSIAGVMQIGENDLSNAQSDLGLLALFSNSTGKLKSDLDLRDRALTAATTVQQASIAASGVNDERRTIEAAFAHSVPNKVIVVSTEDQTARAYENGVQVLSTPVTTGGPELPTGLGIFHIYEKISPFVFHSPFPMGSPYYYSPTPVQFWMPFDDQEGLHDASWRSNFGPGSNLAPTDLGNGNVILGTHGCVNLPYDAAQFIWNWAPLGTTVVVT